MQFHAIAAELLIALAVSFSWGWWGRMDGGAPPKTPEVLERLMNLVPQIALGLVLGFAEGFFCLAGYGGIAGGHGQYFPTLSVKAIAPEWCDFIVRLFFGDDPRTADEFRNLRDIRPENLERADHDRLVAAMEKYGMDRLRARCAVGMALSGLAVTLPLVVVLIIHGCVLSGILAMLAGAQKAVAYQIAHLFTTKGWTGWLPEHLKSATEIGEFINRSVYCFLIYLAFKALSISLFGG